MIPQLNLSTQYGKKQKLPKKKAKCKFVGEEMVFVL